MSSLLIAGIAFACILAGTLLGMLVRRAVPDHHMSGDSKDAIKQGLALIATLTALVLGLLVATTKGTFDTQTSAVRESAANFALLDRVLARYGPEAKKARELIPAVVEVVLKQTWPEGGRPANLTSAEVQIAGEALFDDISALEPKTDLQRLLKGRALEIAISLGQTRQRILAQKESSIPLPFLVILVFWLTILFGCYGLLAPGNVTVIAVLIVCMISASCALVLVLEMDRPFDGIVRVSNAPLRAALTRLGN